MYRAIEDSPEDEDFLALIQTDAEAFANSSTLLIKPQAKRNVINEYKKWLVEEALLGVIICLLPESDTNIAAHASHPEKEEKSHDWIDKSEKKSPVPIGIIALTQEKDQLHHRNASISLDIAASHQRKGFGSEAIAWALQWAFQISGLHRVSIESISYNEGATRLYERLGFTPEGRSREAVYFDGEFHDILSFGILEGEWRERWGERVVPFRRCRH